MSQSVVWAVIPAAGIGSRMSASTPKQYLPLLKQAVIVHAVQRLANTPAVKGIWIGISEHDHYWSQHNNTFKKMPKFRGTYTGGDERAKTVLNGLHTILQQADPLDWVLVHDAARPCVRVNDVTTLVSTVIQSNCVGGLLAVPVADTVKRADREQTVTETVSREGLWRALTPQMFRLGELKQALETGLENGLNITDEASAIEYNGGKPLVVSGHADNIKITLPQDLDLAELFLRKQQSEGQ